MGVTPPGGLPFSGGGPLVFGLKKHAHSYVNKPCIFTVTAFCSCPCFVPASPDQHFSSLHVEAVQGFCASLRVDEMLKRLAFSCMQGYNETVHGGTLYDCDLRMRLEME